MANIASVAYAIEGPKKDLEEIFVAILNAVNTKDNRYEEYIAAETLKLPIEEGKTRLRGEISNDPTLENGVLRFWAEERWGLQDFEELLRKKFPDITVYWVVEEPGMEIYCTNDKKGKYFRERYWVDTAQDAIYQSEYFKTEEDMYKWLNEKYGVKSEEEVEAWNADYEDSGTDDENFIYIHEFEIEDYYGTSTSFIHN